MSECKNWMLLSEDEKKTLLNKGFEKWRKGEQPYKYLKNKYQVALTVVGEYYNNPPHIENDISPYYAPKEVMVFYENGGFKTTPIEWQNDVLKLFNLKHPYIIY